MTKAPKIDREAEAIRCERCSKPIRSKRLLRLAAKGYRAHCAACDREAQR